MCIYIYDIYVYFQTPGFWYLRKQEARCINRYYAEVVTVQVVIAKSEQNT